MGAPCLLDPRLSSLSMTQPIYSALVAAVLAGFQQAGHPFHMVQMQLVTA